jgi:hypothetical protein
MMGIPMTGTMPMTGFPGNMMGMMGNQPVGMFNPAIFAQQQQPQQQKK